MSNEITQKRRWSLAKAYHVAVNMLRPIISIQKTAIISITLILLCVFIFSATDFHKHTRVVEQKIKDTANSFCYNDGPVFGNPPARTLFHKLFDVIRHEITAFSYKDPSGKIFEVKEDAPWWTESLRNKILIVDIDTRVPAGKNELWNDGRMDWEGMGKGAGSMISASFINHFLYAQIHGYDYRFFNADELKEMHNTWVKPSVLFDLLESYQFVVFIDADATVQHLDVPLEWLFNRWGITPQTSIAMPLDTRQNLNGDEHASEDSRGKLQLNTGVIIAQALPHTFDMLTAWKECPDEKKYPGCGTWKQTWSHEQKAFSEYIRYDYNPNGTNIIEIPCNDAMGYPGIEDADWIMSNCYGQFIRHHTIDKAKTKKSTETAMIQVMVDLARKELLGHKEEYWIHQKKAE